MIEVRVPTSKSLTQRALVLAALAPGRSTIVDPLLCDDSFALRRALTSLGIHIREDNGDWVVDGGAALRAPTAALQLENAGTATRFCAGLSLLVRDKITLDGDDAMRRRPMSGLLDALQNLGAEVIEKGHPGCPPLVLTPPPDPSRIPRRVELNAAGSSQQLSALLLAAPRLPGGLEITLSGELPSRPYVALTLNALQAFGVTVQRETDPHSRERYRVPPQTLRAARYVVEGDHSSASYPLAAGFLTDREVSVVNAPADSSQGDRVFASLLEALRAPAPRTFELSDTPDIAPTLATCALFVEGATHLRGLAHLRIKECDRLSVLATGFRQVGADLDELPDGLVIRPTPLHGDVALDPARDHRMAMCFGLLGLKLPGVRVAEPGCVSKSYPAYFEMLEGFRPQAT